MSHNNTYQKRVVCLGSTNSGNSLRYTNEMWVFEFAGPRSKSAPPSSPAAFNFTLPEGLAPLAGKREALWNPN